jgi:hypothetical protein
VKFDADGRAVRHRVVILLQPPAYFACLHPNHRVISGGVAWRTLKEINPYGVVARIELHMGLRPTHRNENHFEPRAFTIELAWNGKGRNDPGAVEAVIEFGLGCVLEPICVAPSTCRGGLVARDGV